HTTLFRSLAALAIAQPGFVLRMGTHTKLDPDYVKSWTKLAIYEIEPKLRSMSSGEVHNLLAHLTDPSMPDHEKRLDVYIRARDLGYIPDLSKQLSQETREWILNEMMSAPEGEPWMRSTWLRDRVARELAKGGSST